MNFPLPAGVYHKKEVFTAKEMPLLHECHTSKSCMDGGLL